jgi:hypothetical protein
LIVAFFMTIMVSIETSAEALQRLFLAPGAPLGQAWLQTSKIPLLVNSLHLLTLATQVAPAAKARSVYRHGRKARQMHKISGTHWSPGLELANCIKQESKRLNPIPMLAALAWMHTLRCNLAGGIILVIQQFAKDNTFTPLYITVVAVPTIATLGSVLAADPPGFACSDFWDKSVLSQYAFDVDGNNRCPLLVAPEDFSHQVKLLLLNLLPIYNLFSFPLGNNCGRL